MDLAVSSKVAASGLFSQRSPTCVYPEERHCKEDILMQQIVAASIIFTILRNDNTEILDRKEPELEYMLNIFSQHFLKQRKWLLASQISIHFGIKAFW